MRHVTKLCGEEKNKTLIFLIAQSQETKDFKGEWTWKKKRKWRVRERRQTGGWTGDSQRLLIQSLVLMPSTPCSPKSPGQSPYQHDVKPEWKDPLRERTELHGKVSQVKVCHKERKGKFCRLHSHPEFFLLQSHSYWNIYLQVEERD